MRRIIVNANARIDRRPIAPMLDGERGPAAAAGDVDSGAHGAGLRRVDADGHHAGAHRQHDLPRRRDARIRGAAGVARRARRGADDAERERRRRVRLEGLGGVAGVGGEGGAADARVRADGRGPDLDVRAVSNADAADVRSADRVGRIERDRVRELRDWRADRALSGSAGHLLCDHRSRASGRSCTSPRIARASC